MTSDQIWLRSELMGTQVITRNTGRRLGIVSEVLVDVDRREIVALGLRDNILSRIVPGVARYMYLRSICQVGDVILVETDEAIEDIDPTPFSALLNSEVLTEAGDMLGRVRSFKFNIESGNLEALVIGATGIALVPDQMLSTYELPVEEIVSSGPDRIIVFEGSEEKLQQVTVGVLERLGIGSPPWEKEEDSYILPTIPAENQLPSGAPVANATVRRDEFGDRLGQRYQPKQEPEWSEDDYYEEEPIEPVRREQQKRYLEAEPEEDRWSDASRGDRYAPDRYAQERYGEDRYSARPSSSNDDQGNDDYYDDERESAGYGARPESSGTAVPKPDEDLGSDAWAEKGEAPLPPLTMPEKQKQPEYEDG